jgi:hypothetical protein
MGMDVYGKAPTAKVGEYFRRSVWGWRPLADFVLANADEQARGCKYWHSNDGDGLDAAGAVALAERLNALVADGTAADWIKLRDAGLAVAADVGCEFCAGLGIRRDEVGQRMGWVTAVVGAVDADGRPNPRAGRVGSCNACGGRGSRRPSSTYYPLRVEDIQEFAAFLAACGGFEIY